MVKLTKNAETFRHGQMERDLREAKSELVRKDTQLSYASEAIQIELRKRESAEQRLKSEGGEVVVSAYRGHGPCGDRWTLSIAIDQNSVSRSVSRSPNPMLDVSSQVASSMCHKAERDLTKLLQDIFIGRPSR